MFKNIFLNSVVLALFGVVVTGCSSTGKHVNQTQNIAQLAKPLNMKDYGLVQSRLKSQYGLWKGAPYLYGGTSRRGVDCSAFVQNTYRHAFGYDLPRTTRTQINQGFKVSKSELKPGDVVFFRIKSNALHNGVYLGGKRFIHASSSKGVTISRLDNVYWKKTYYTARRMH